MLNQIFGTYAKKLQNVFFGPDCVIDKECHNPFTTRKNVHPKPHTADLAAFRHVAGDNGHHNGHPANSLIDDVGHQIQGRPSFRTPYRTPIRMNPMHVVLEFLGGMTADR